VWWRIFAEDWPEKFNNKTNGITPRRWLLKANSRLTQLITGTVGPAWITDLTQLRRLEPSAEDAAFREQFWLAKRANKEALASFFERKLKVLVSPDSPFDVQVKLHEYKRQLLLVLYILVLYNRLKKDPGLANAPRALIFGAKAAPGYFMAKLIVKLIHQVAEVINRDLQIGGKLKVVFLPNYRVPSSSGSSRLPI